MEAVEDGDEITIIVLFCARRSPRLFTCLNLLDLHNEGGTLFNLILQMSILILNEAQKTVSFEPKVAQLGRGMPRFLPLRNLF